jgi:hypothetical protein
MIRIDDVKLNESLAISKRLQIKKTEIRPKLMKVLKLFLKR